MGSGPEPALEEIEDKTQKPDPNEQGSAPASLPRQMAA